MLVRENLGFGLACFVAGALGAVAFAPPARVSAAGNAIPDERVVEAGELLTVRTGKVLNVDAGDQIILKTGDARLEMRKDGTITLHGKAGTMLLTREGFVAKAAADLPVKGAKVGGN